MEVVKASEDFYRCCLPVLAVFDFYGSLIKIEIGTTPRRCSTYFYFKRITGMEYV